MRSRARRGLALALLCVALASCAMPERERPRAMRPARVSGPVVADAPVKIGDPYVIDGITYVPRDERSYDQTGLASWYGSESGERTANGERFRPGWISAAHKTLPLPSYAEVTALATGRTILLRVNDRGPFVSGRIIDLSSGAADALGMRHVGTTAVRVRRVEPGERDRIALRSGRLASPRPYARPVLPPPPVVVPPRPRPPLILDLPPPEPDAASLDWYVQVASFSSRDNAAALLPALATMGPANVAAAGAFWRARLGPYRGAKARTALAQVQARGYQGAMLVRP